MSWNIARSHEPWRQLLQMDADVALLQEAAPPPDDVARLQDAALPPAEGTGPLDIGPREAWDSHSWNSDWWRGRWSALYDRWPMVVRLSDRVDIEWFKQVGPVWRHPASNEIAVSGIGTIAAARVTPRDGAAEPFIAVSMYGQWIGSHPSVKTSWNTGYADASVHRIISDLSAFIGHENPLTHGILAAGDLNIAHGYGDGGSPPYWEARYRAVFERIAAIGLEFMGPQEPNGRQAEVRATHEPPDSRNVVMFYLPGKNPAAASNNQLDYVFASRGFHESVKVRAMNGIEEWGASDHCRLFIEIDYIRHSSPLNVGIQGPILLFGGCQIGCLLLPSISDDSIDDWANPSFKVGKCCLHIIILVSVFVMLRIQITVNKEVLWR